MFSGGWGANESLEDLENMQKDRQLSEEKQQKEELLEGQFNWLDEVINLKNKLPNLVEPKESEQILSRLFLKYKSNSEEFDFKNSLEQVFFGQKEWVFKSTWVVLEKNNKQEVVDTIFSKEEMQWIEEIDSIWDNKWEILKHNNSVENIPESAQPIVQSIKSKTGSILLNTSEKETIKEKPKQENKTDIEQKMQKNLGLESGKELWEKLYNTESRSNNLKQAKEIFFSPDKVKQYSSKNPKLEQFGEGIFEWEWMDEDLREILWNFVINSETTNLSDLDPKDTNEALNNAFDLEVAQLLEWKVNYKEETIIKLRKDMLSSDNPLEKLQIFKNLKDVVNVSVGSLATKSEKLKKKTSWEKEAITKKLKLLQKEFHSWNITPERKKQIRVDFNTLKEQLKTVKSWEVMQWWKLDMNKTNNEKISEAA